MSDQTLAVLTVLLSFLQFLALAGSLFYIARQAGSLRDSYLGTIQEDARQRAMDFISRFNSKDMIELRGSAVQAMFSYQSEQVDSKLKESLGHHLFAYLNFFEELAMAINYDLADEVICRSFFRQILLTTCGGASRIFDDNASQYLNLKDLRERWQAPLPAPPPLPGVASVARRGPAVLKR